MPAQEVGRLRAVLLAESLESPAGSADTGRVLARWQPTWLRFSPLTFTGLVLIVAALGFAAQPGLLPALRDSSLGRQAQTVAESVGVLTAVAVGVAGLLLASVALSVAQSLLTYGNLLLRRDAEVLHLSHGLVRVREHTFDMRRLRGGTLREPLLVRLFGGARLDAVMTGVAGVGEASQLLPPCPRGVAETVLADLIARPDAVAGPLRAHGPAATQRRWTRAMALPSVVAAGLIVTAATAGVPAWGWSALAVLVLFSAFLAFDRARSLGHRVGGGWLVARQGSIQRRRDCVSASGIIGWTVRQSLWQRRAGVATLVAATAAGVKRYEIVDVPADTAWSIAATVSPWIATSSWARR